MNNYFFSRIAVPIAGHKLQIVFPYDGITGTNSQQTTSQAVDSTAGQASTSKHAQKTTYYSDACVQTDLCMEREVQQWKNAIRRYDKEVAFLRALREKLHRDLLIAKNANQITVTALEANDKKCCYFTGLSSGRTLRHLYEALKADLPVYETLDKEKILILMLRKLRLNEPFCTLGYLYGLNQTAISKYFFETINATIPFLNELVRFPSRTVLKQHMPSAFRRKYGDSVTIIIDCFEINVESPNTKAMVASANVFSYYKKHNTIKVLIGISPSGAIIYVSEAFGGRTSDKEMVKSSGFLDKIQEGDFVMADRGFLIEDLLCPLNASVAYPAFKKKNSQLEPLDAVHSRELSSLRIHVERLIGSLRQKFLILTDIIPITMLQHWNNDTPAIDQILTICAALVNLCPTIVRSV